MILLLALISSAVVASILIDWVSRRRTPWLKLMTLVPLSGAALIAFQPCQDTSDAEPPGIETVRELDCPALLEDARFLSSVFRRVTDAEYRPTRKNCLAVMTTLSDRDLTYTKWFRSRGVTSTAADAESRQMTAARSFGDTCPVIVRKFACEGAAKMRNKSGGEAPARARVEFLRIISELQRRCAK